MSYIESAEDYTHTHTHTLELIKEFSKIERYKIQHTFLYLSTLGSADVGPLVISQMC